MIQLIKSKSGIDKLQIHQFDVSFRMEKALYYQNAKLEK